MYNAHDLLSQGPNDPRLLIKETSKDPVLAQVLHCVKKEGPPNQCSDELQNYKKLGASLSSEHGYMFYGLRVVIPASLEENVLQLLHLVHFGMQRMKQLRRSAVYWPQSDQDIERISRHCTACAEFQNQPAKPAIHQWMGPEKPWSRLYIDHGISFLGHNWLV